MAETLQLLHRLSDNKVEFVIIGGVAAIAYGSSVGTYDLDVCAPMTNINCTKIIEALKDVHPRWRMRPDLPIITPDSHHLHNLKNMYIRTDIGQLDILGELPGVCTYEELIPRSQQVNFGGVLCHMVDIDTLIAAKKFAGRNKDLVVVQELEVIKIENKKDA